MIRLVLLGAIAAAGCRGGDDEGRRIQVPEDGISFVELDGWSTQRDRDTFLLSGPGDTVIAIRTARIDGNGMDRRDEGTVLSAVETVLRALPQARVSGPRHIDDARYPAVIYQVDFVPPRAKRVHFERQHVVLFGHTRLLHVMLTGRAGEIERHVKALEAVVDTIREEG